MKLEKENIPPVVSDLARNLFDESNRFHIRENYYRTLTAIRKYCDEMIFAFEKQKEKEERKKRA